MVGSRNLLKAYHLYINLVRQGWPGKLSVVKKMVKDKGWWEDFKVAMEGKHGIDWYNKGNFKDLMSYEFP